MKTIKVRSLACSTEDKRGAILWTIVPEVGEPFRLEISRGQGALVAPHLVNCLAADVIDRTAVTSD